MRSFENILNISVKIVLPYGIIFRLTTGVQVLHRLRPFRLPQTFTTEFSYRSRWVGLIRPTACPAFGLQRHSGSLPYWRNVSRGVVRFEHYNGTLWPTPARLSTYSCMLVVLKLCWASKDARKSASFLLLTNITVDSLSAKNQSKSHLQINFFQNIITICIIFWIFKLKLWDLMV